jgi:hypothetical protein
MQVDADETPKDFIAGAEYLFGRRETLEGNTGDAHRFMFVVNLTN